MPFAGSEGIYGFQNAQYWLRCITESALSWQKSYVLKATTSDLCGTNASIHQRDSLQASEYNFSGIEAVHGFQNAQ
jgi:hypothetical protein